MEFTVHPVTDGDRAWVLEVVRRWGADFIVTRGRCVYPSELEGFYAMDAQGKRVALVTYEVIGDQCEVVSLDAFRKFCGLGTALMERVEAAARERACRRLWLITTNDNLDAMRFYQRRGFTLAAVHVDAIAASRKLKPTIRQVGDHGIPLRDEIEFEKML